MYELLYLISVVLLLYLQHNYLQRQWNQEPIFIIPEKRG